MMNRRRFLLTSLAGALALVAPAAGQAQGPTRVPTIGVLSPVSPTTPSFVRSRGAFEAGLKELGWTPGHTVRIDYRHADGQRDRLSELARELVRARIDVVVARSAAAVQAAKEATSTTPIVMSASGLDPVQLGFVSSLARPGGNITGLTLLTYELLGKQLELLREAVPRMSRVVVLGNAAAPLPPKARLALDAAGRALGIQLQYVEVRHAAGLDGAFAEAVRAQPARCWSAPIRWCWKPTIDGWWRWPRSTGCLPCTGWTRMRSSAP